ncbi:hypothetical protein [Microbacterium capsulatum]|uniref:Uncharacterized protein n=1 Tax=Microbacterium capsulatum TaxID=3041921 RepID=A0ABU0XG15_9MICO|nr:hypothetical protein [Microbacterium sp. ASV81]MDQ4214067.1 hypothetical protein [Microbacterium sp. ASV81]
MAEFNLFPKITPSEAFGRVLVASLPVGAMIALGAMLIEGSLLTWFSTMIVMTAQALLGSPFRGVQIMRRVQELEANPSRFGELLDALSAFLASYPILRLMNANFLFLLARAVLFGIVIATFEQGVSGVLFGPSGLFGSSGLSPLITGLVTLPLVLFPTYLTLNYLREKRTSSASPEVAVLWAAIEKARGASLTPGKRAALAAFVSVSGAVIIRATAIAIFPFIFASLPGKIFLVLIALWFVVNPEMPLSLLRMLVTAASRAEAHPNDPPAPNEREAR